MLATGRAPVSSDGGEVGDVRGDEHALLGGCTRDQVFV